MVDGSDNTLESLVKKYASSDTSVNIAFGLRPSGTIHLGNMVTMALASGLGGEIGPHYSQLQVTICDLDLPSRVDWRSHREGYVLHYKNMPDNLGCHADCVDHVEEMVSDFLDATRGETGTNFTIRRLSDIQREPSFREGLKRVLDTEGITRLICQDSADDLVWVYPLCPSCDTSFNNHKSNLKNTYEDGLVHSHCTNDACEVGEYSVDVLDTTHDIAVHMFIDPLRDAVVEPYADIHVFGGDYAKSHSSNRIPKIEKIRRITEIASGREYSPDILLGPVIYSRSGSKLSKSEKNGLDMSRLKEYFGGEYPHHVLAFTMGVVREGYNHVDYPEVRNRLLKTKL